MEDLGPYRDLYINIQVRDPDGNVLRERPIDETLDVTGFDWSKHDQDNPFVIEVTETHPVLNQSKQSSGSSNYLNF